ncbi:MAG: hypothetical protein ACPGJV_15715 [Bacteriovoracaceae bacterium]
MNKQLKEDILSLIDQYQKLDRFNGCIIIGNLESHNVWSYESGNGQLNKNIPIASLSKIITAFILNKTLSEKGLESNALVRDLLDVDFKDKQLRFNQFLSCKILEQNNIQSPVFSLSSYLENSKNSIHQEYSNENYYVLSLMLEEILQSPYENILEANFPNKTIRCIAPDEQFDGFEIADGETKKEIKFCNNSPIKGDGAITIKPIELSQIIQSIFLSYLKSFSPSLFERKSEFQDGLFLDGETFYMTGLLGPFQSSLFFSPFEKYFVLCFSSYEIDLVYNITKNVFHLANENQSDDYRLKKAYEPFTNCTTLGTYYSKSLNKKLFFVKKKEHIYAQLENQEQYKMYTYCNQHTAFLLKRNVLFYFSNDFSKVSFFQNNKTFKAERIS